MVVAMRRPDSLPRAASRPRSGTVLSTALSSSRTLKRVDIRDVLGSPGRNFVRNQGVPRDDRHWQAIEYRHFARSEALVEPDAGDRGRHLDSQWRASHADDFVRPQEQGWLDVRPTESKLG